MYIHLYICIYVIILLHNYMGYFKIANMNMIQLKLP